LDAFGLANTTRRLRRPDWISSGNWPAPIRCAAKKDQPDGAEAIRRLVKDTLLEEPKHSARWRKGHGRAKQGAIAAWTEAQAARMR
jgi:hypothetical protein